MNKQSFDFHSSDKNCFQVESLERSIPTITNATQNLPIELLAPAVPVDNPQMRIEEFGPHLIQNGPDDKNDASNAFNDQTNFLMAFLSSGFNNTNNNEQPSPQVGYRTSDLEPTTQNVRLVCPTCGFISYDKMSHIIHLKTHGESRCLICDFVCRTEGRLKTHMSECHTDEERRKSAPEMLSGSALKKKRKRYNYQKPKTCTECGHLSSSKDEHWLHKRVHIPIEKQLNCSQCNFVTMRQCDLNLHLKNHVRDNSFKCTKCTYTCATKGMLTSHMKSHSNNYPFKCEFCLYKTKYHHCLKSHLERTHRRQSLDDIKVQLMTDGSNMSLLQTNETQLFKCNMCEFVTGKQDEFMSHGISHFDILTNNDAFNISRLSEKIAHSPESMDHNFMNQNGNIMINQSSARTFGDPPVSTDGQDFLAQAWIALNGEIISCECCKMPFTNHHDYASHLLLHTIDNPFKCWKCNEQLHNGFAFALHCYGTMH